VHISLKSNKRIGLAEPRDVDIAKTYYHGTNKADNAEAILREGIKAPEIIGRGGKMAPVKGRVYLTSDIRYAILYTLGANAIGTDFNFLDERYGYLFVIDGKKLTDIQPDEDSVGELLYDVLNNTPLQYSSEDMGKVNWLKWIAKDRLTPLQYDNAKQYKNFGDLSAAGKKLLKYMSDEQKLQLIDLGAHISNDSVLFPDQAWEFDKNLNPQLNQDVSNFFELAERIL